MEILLQVSIWAEKATIAMDAVLKSAPEVAAFITFLAFVLVAGLSVLYQHFRHK